MKDESVKQKEVLMRGDMAVITDIQRYSVHDGPGIRSLVFFKGCPLRCQWCHNPETHNPLPELIFFQELCIGCGACVAQCPTQSISVQKGQMVKEKKSCTLSGRCVEVCCSGARKMSGVYYTVDEVYSKVIRDRAFYETTGGGVTLSGGEVLVYWKFAAKLLEKLHGEDIHTAIETSGYASWENFSEVLAHTDLVLFDIKHCDDKIHKEYTGKSNCIIMENLKKLSEQNKQVIIRVPVIPGFNDTVENLIATARIAKQAGAKELHLLPFHQIGESKWDSIGKDYHFRNVKEPTKERMSEIKNIVEQAGIPAVVGGS